MFSVDTGAAETPDPGRGSKASVLLRRLVQESLQYEEKPKIQGSTSVEQKRGNLCRPEEEWEAPLPGAL